MSSSKFWVWHEHQVIAEYDLDKIVHTTEGFDLVIFEKGKEIARHADGEWSGASPRGSSACTYITPDPNCPNCKTREQ